MDNLSQSILADAAGLPLAFDALRAAAIRDLEGFAKQLGNGQWTDFNAHDPGITILEQFCWALTDLGYRLGHPIPDLLAEGGGDGRRGLVAPGEALGCGPVTLADLRRLILDCAGVRNCWFEPDQTPAPALYAHREAGTIGTVERRPETISLRLKGLWRVLIVADGSPGVVTEVAKRLYAYRPLCQDFTEVRVLDTEPIKMQAGIELGPVTDAQAVLERVLLALDDAISPRVRFQTLAGRLGSGTAETPLEAVLEGPRLEHGFIADEDLPEASRPESLRVSDLIHALMDLPGVRAVRDLKLCNLTPCTATDWEPWVLPLDPARVPRLTMTAEEIGDLIRLYREGVRLQLDGARALKVLTDARNATVRPLLAPSEREPALPLGRDRHVGRYRSILNQFPQCYGVGPDGLPAEAAPERRGRMKQLKAYLQLLDQPLADAFAQTAAAGALLAWDGSVDQVQARGQIVPDGLDLEQVRADGYDGVVAQRPTGSVDGATLRRLQLDHLLARVGEVYIDPPARPGAAAGPDPIAARQGLLEALGTAAAARGTAIDSLQGAGAANRSGLAWRIALKLGLDPEKAEETLFVVEHLLLRSIPGDDLQSGPLLTALPEGAPADPYSLQLTLVFLDPAPGSPAADDRAKGYREFVENLVRAETPAHLTPYVQWLSPEAFAAFATDWRHWHKSRLESLQDRYGTAA